ncbi:putative Zn-dependent protease [Rhodobium orientis]|uniref:Metalloprotease n=1 Tax=Rhodobium orientis TaxID=34017 RepID=A0A327JD62_9HYPH|nr:M48 family metalloprotease [Rhodobium orientis]MBB4305659.1 putative Zn-dependent protease [Rhodobium orientis]MBK5950935.1 metalloprotease [Rhodobium orientis]RAI23879.1 metalloprotease [Rhodobium orientis]
MTTGGTTWQKLLRLGAVLTLVVATAGCQLFSRGVTISDPVIDTPGPPTGESTIGAREHPRVVAAYGGVYEDRGAERAIARMVGRLVAASDNPAQSYRITILNSPVVNAFALPGGYLYVTRGLLALANDSAELAAVISHEMAHVTAHHAIARLKRAEATAVVSRVVANVVDDPERQKEALASAKLSFARFSQIQELEADAVGVKTLSKAGYDPYAASRFLKAMAEFSNVVSARGAGDQPDFLSSHPTTPERIVKARNAARAINAPGFGERGRDAYLNSLNGMLYGDDPREGFVRGRSFLHAGLGIAFTVPGDFTLENSKEAVLASNGSGTALRFDGTNVPASMSLADYLRSGWINGLISESVRDTEIAGQPAATASAVAEGWSFRIAALRANGATYRFIFATREPTQSFDLAFRTTISSFRMLSGRERAELRPLRVRIVTARQGDSIDRMAARMAGIAPDRRAELFKVLNGLDDDSELQPGMLVKIIAE